MSINYTLEHFAGPLDLLLQLVRRSEISVWEIRIQEICEQFIAYTRHLETVDVDQAGDFLVMAATLMRIKARLLLPRPEPDEPTEDGEMLDEEEQLIARLLLYEGFREAADELERMAELAGQVFTRGQPEELPAPAPGDPLSGVTLLTLAVMVQQALAELPEPEITIRGERYSLAGQMAHLRNRLSGNWRGGFRQLLSAHPTRLEIVVTFLAVLELVRLQEIAVAQDSGTGEVEIWRRE